MFIVCSCWECRGKYHTSGTCTNPEEKPVAGSGSPLEFELANKACTENWKASKDIAAAIVQWTARLEVESSDKRIGEIEVCVAAPLLYWVLRWRNAVAVVASVCICTASSECPSVVSNSSAASRERVCAVLLHVTGLGAGSHGILGFSIESTLGWGGGCCVVRSDRDVCQPNDRPCSSMWYHEWCCCFRVR